MLIQNRLEKNLRLSVFVDRKFKQHIMTELFDHFLNIDYYF